MYNPEVIFGIFKITILGKSETKQQIVSETKTLYALPPILPFVNLETSQSVVVECVWAVSKICMLQDLKIYSETCGGSNEKC